MTGPATPGRTRLAVLHSCGHEVFHEIGGPPRTRRWQAEQRGQRPCADCKKLAWMTDTAVDNATFAAIADEQDLPKLEGTERQVVWATTLRGQLLDSLPVKLVELNKLAGKRGHDTIAVDGAGIAVIRRVILSETSAPWWIENRKQLGQKLCARHRSAFVASGAQGQAARRLLLWAGG
jgi:hypothetical protein